MYSFNVKWYYNDEEVEDTGVVCAHSFSNAMDKLSEYFGNDEMIKGTIEAFSDDDSDILILKKDVKEFMKC
jgi:hypothetical protein